MSFVFSRRFYVLVAIGLVSLSLSWGRPWLRWATLAYDLLLLMLAFLDFRISKVPDDVIVQREFAGRFAIGAETEVTVRVINESANAVRLRIKDEYPPMMALSAKREAEF